MTTANLRMEQADKTVSVFLFFFGLVQSTISGKTINQPMTVFWGLCGRVQREPQPQCQHQGRKRRSDATARPLAGTWLEAETEERLMFSLGSGSTIASDISAGQLFEQSADWSSYRVRPYGQQRSWKDQYKSRYKKEEVSNQLSEDQSWKSSTLLLI